MNETKIGLLAEAYNQYASIQEKISKIGHNTGNLAFYTAIHSMIDCHVVRAWDKNSLSELDYLISTEFIWLRENVAPPANSTYWLKNLNIPLVLLSVGLQSHYLKLDFKLHPETVEVLSAVQERSKIFARGIYTAEVLNKSGIKNVEVIGCPSVYQFPLYASSRDRLWKEKKPRRVLANYRTLLAPFTPRDEALLKYISDNANTFIEQTLYDLTTTKLSSASFTTWLQENEMLFFDLESWIRHNSTYDFSFGLRFHGNVVAMLAGARALFLTIDSRTREMTDFFELPAMKVDEFDCEKSLDYYYEKANCEVFLSKYDTKLRTTLGALEGAGLRLRDDYKKKVEQYLENSPKPSVPTPSN